MAEYVDPLSYNPEPWFWPLMTQTERRMWMDPKRPLGFRGRLEHRMNKLHKFVPPMTLVAVEQNIFGEHRPAPSIADPKYGAFMGPEGFAFPNRPVMPVEMAVFDDAAWMERRREELGRSAWGVPIAVTMVLFGLALACFGLWSLAQ